MMKWISSATIVVLALVLMQEHARAQERADASDGFEKKTYNFNEWTKGRFSEMVTVTHPGKFITLAGIGAEEEGNGRNTVHKGDMLGQCRYAFMKIKKALATQGATLADTTRIIVFMTTMEPYADWVKCRTEAFGDGPLPASTVVQISRLASPDMMIEINIDAVTK